MRTEGQWELSRQSLVDILGEKHYTPGEFVDVLGAPSFTALLKSIKPIAVPCFKALLKAKVRHHRRGLNKRFSKGCWEIKSYTFTYRSQAVDGREIILSGRVTFPGNKEEGIPNAVKTISLHTHQAFFHPEWAPSQNLMFMPLKALWDSAVIEPDLQKWGINHGVEPDGGGSALHMARQLADCTVAALELMQQRGVTLEPNGYTTNWGSSQGAFPALLFAKWYDTEAPQWFKETLRLRSTFVAEAAIALPELVKYTYHHPELIFMGHIPLLGYFQAFSPEQLGGYRPRDFVPGWYMDTKFQVDGKEISFLDAISLYYPQFTDPVVKKMNSFDQLVAPDMLSADGEVDLDSPKVRAWFSCLRKHNDVEGWTPAHSLYIAHSPEDDMIPFEMVYDLYRTISNEGRNARVHMLSVPSVRFLLRGGMNPHFVTAFVGLVIMAFVQNPEDMCKLYKSVQ